MDIHQRHDLDRKVLDFTIEKFEEHMDEDNSFSFIYRSEELKIEVNKREVRNIGNKISVHIFKVDKERLNKDGYRTNPPFSKKITHTLSIDSSNELRKYIEFLEDKKNQDFLRNTSDELSEFLDSFQ